jgi:CheY-like chemotaxis protein
LIVEDQENVRRLAAVVLQECGYHVLEAESGEQALAVSKTYPGPIDLVLTDVVMPGMSGAELATRLKVSRPRLLTLYMSGYAGSAIGEHGVLGEGVGFLPKPFTPESLAGKVQQLLARGAEAPSILVVDDEAAVRTLFRQILSGAGFRVTEAADGAQALALLRDRRFDVVITDLVMPDREGIETIGEIRRSYPAVKIIAVSGAFGGQFLKTASLLGAHATLSKPVPAAVLIGSVQRLLGEG